MSKIFNIENLQDTRFSLSEEFEKESNTLSIELIDTTADIVIASYEIGRATDSEIDTLSLQTNFPKELDLYTGSLHSHMPNQGIGLAMWQYGELSFARKYKGPYLKLTYDMSEDVEEEGRTLWTSKKGPYVLSYLESNGVEICHLWSGNLRRGVPAWLYTYHYKGI